MERIEEELGAMGVEVQTLSGDQYEIVDDQRGWYAAVAIPPGKSSRDVSDALCKIVQRFPNPLTWASLAKDAGDEELASKHTELAEALGL